MIKDVHKSEIDWQDFSFRFGKKTERQELADSIRKYGIVEKPLLIEGQKGYRIFSGFNRLETGADFLDSFPVEIIPSATEYLFTSEVGKKLFHDRVGPVGRIRICEIYLQQFSGKAIDDKDTGKKVPGLPVDFYPGTSDYEKLAGLPQSFRDYCDDREISFKIIKGLLSLGERVLKSTVSLAASLKPGKNNFRKLVDLVTDIEQLSGTEGCAASLEKAHGDGKADSFDDLYEFLFRLRYPEFSRLDEERKNILKRINSSSVTFQLPEYFEGDEIRINARIRKGENVEGVLKKISETNINLLEELIKLL